MTKPLRKQASDRVWDRVSDQVPYSVRRQVRDQVWTAVLGDQVWESARSWSIFIRAKEHHDQISK